tara:strand:- start:3139 stop:3699 length:561 start_codon:yes stop_codon:yes gene_type:complete
MGLTMSDWTEVLKIVPKFGVAGNEQKINQEIEVFQEQQITPFVENIVGNLKQGQLPVFKLRVDNNSANSGPQGDTFVVGRDQIRRLGGDPNRIKAKLQQVFKKAGYKAKGSFMGKDMTVSIPKTSTYGGKKMTDPRQFQAREQRGGFMNRLRRGGRRVNPMTRFKDDRARQFIEDKPQSSAVQGQF